MMKKKKSSVIAIVILFISLILIFTGISYAVFNYFGQGMTNNVIQTGRVVFSYSDANGGGNGINIQDATPIPDDMGVLLSGEGEYFDFSVSASTTSNNLAYEVTALKNSNSTLPEEFIKVYLTTLNGNQESKTELTYVNNDIVTYDKLIDTTNPLLEGKTIYYGKVQAGEVAYGQRFRLRMWIKMPTEENFDYSTLDNKYFSLKVNVAASSVY